MSTSCRLIVAVYGPDGLCFPGANPHRMVLGEARVSVSGAGQADLTARVHGLLLANGVRVLRAETVKQGGCFTLILSAETDGCSSSSLADLRARLDAGAAQLGVRIRVQREEIFAYMHRI
ncbi:MAG: ACT domain-containing protein [Candidatus Eremiobacterota bacterium]